MSVTHKGRIVDENGQSLWGAHVVTLNSTPKRATTTDVNGYFGISGDIGESFQISYLGFKPQNFTLQAINMDKTYRLIESAEQLDEVTVTPSTTTTTTNSTKNPFDLGNFFSSIGDIFNGATQQIATPPIVSNGITTTGTQGQVYNPGTPDNESGILDWFKNNPLWTGAIVLGAIAGTGYVLSKKDEKAKDKVTAKKTSRKVAIAK